MNDLVTAELAETRCPFTLWLISVPPQNSQNSRAVAGGERLC